LLKELKDTYPYVCFSAIDALVEIKSPEAVNLLIGMRWLRYADTELYSYAVRALGKTKSPKAVKPLLELLKDTYPDVRRSAADALGEMKSPEAVMPLIEVLKDTNPGVRKSAADALVEIKSPEAVKLLIGMRWLRYADTELHSYAVHALGKTKAPKAVEPLLELLKDTNPGVHSSAASALIEIINILEEKEQLDVLDKVVKIGLAGLYFYQALENIRYIPEDFTNDIKRNT